MDRLLEVDLRVNAIAGYILSSYSNAGGLYNIAQIVSSTAILDLAYRLKYT